MIKKRRGQELTFSRKTNNEYVSNYLTLKNRDDIYKGASTAIVLSIMNLHGLGTVIIIRNMMDQQVKLVRNIAKTRTLV